MHKHQAWLLALLLTGCMTAERDESSTNHASAFEQYGGSLTLWVRSEARTAQRHERAGLTPIESKSQTRAEQEGLEALLRSESLALVERASASSRVLTLRFQGRSRASLEALRDEVIAVGGKSIVAAIVEMGSDAAKDDAAITPAECALDLVSGLGRTCNGVPCDTCYDPTGAYGDPRCEAGIRTAPNGGGQAFCAPWGWHLPEVRAPQAWERIAAARAQGRVLSPVLVGVVDHGVSRTHPDLTGFVTDVGCTTTTCAPGLATGVGEFHGHAIAGAIAARANNRLGVVGLASGATDQVRVLPAAAAVTGADSIAAIERVAFHSPEVRVINLSRLGTNLGTLGAGFCAIAEEISDADNIDNPHHHSVLLVHTAGNDAQRVAAASCPYSLLVSGTDRSGDLFRYYSGATLHGSNWGSHVHIAAPGMQIATTYDVSNGWYGTAKGTSFAAPLVAAAAALIASVAPALTALEIRDILLASADRSRLPATYTPAQSAERFGAGLLDVDAAVAMALATLPPISQCPRADYNQDGLVNSADLAVLLALWNTSSPAHELSGDALINSPDLAVMLACWS